MEMMEKLKFAGVALGILILISASPGIGLNSGSAWADDGDEWSNPHLVTTLVDKNGQQIDKVSIMGRPPKIKAAIATAPKRHIAGATNTLSNVPAFDWCYGCSATSAAMLCGYYDRSGYSNMYTGPANSGVCPLTNATWGEEESPLSATHQGYDGLGTEGHVDDYWYSYLSETDPYYGNWEEHGYADCTADYMGTNQWYNWGNVDGSTTFFYYTNGSPLDDYYGDEPTYRDGCHGLRLFVESRGYTVNSNYNQYIYGYDGNTLGFTWAQYKAEIDAGRPVLIHVTNHTMLGYGYEDPSTVYLHDTWDYDNHSMTWGGTYKEELEHYGVSVIQLAPGATAPTVTNSTGASDITSTSARLNGEVTDTGGENPTVHIYWGNEDGGTIAGNWDTDVNLETKGAGTFYSDISSLTHGTKYYYRCYATNSEGEDWADGTSSFIAGEIKFIGAASDDTGSRNHAANMLCLTRCQAESNGDVVEIKVKLQPGTSSNVKVAIYADSAGAPGSLLNATGSYAATAGWNAISIASTAITSGTYYWLAVKMDTTAAVIYGDGGTIKYKIPITFASDFPDPAGGGYSSLGFHSLLAGYGVITPPSGPTVTNASGATNITSTSARLNGEITDTGGEDPNVTIYYGTSDGGTAPDDWANHVDLPGTYGQETFYAGISGLTGSTTYHYRCYAENSGDSAWADSTETFDTLAPPSAPTVTNGSGATSITSTSARLNGKVTATGGEDPNVTIYYGTTNGGTDSGSWHNNVPLGTKGEETFYADISGLTGSTTYHYRCYAENTGGGAWAGSSETFDTPAEPEKFIGAASDDLGSNTHPANYIFLTRYPAEATGSVTEIKLKAGAPGHAMAAIYTDSGGQPAALLNSTGSTAVSVGWNTIPITSTNVDAGTYYWLAVRTDTKGSSLWGASGTGKYKRLAYGSNWPDPAGTGYTSLSYHSLLAGYSVIVPPTPPEPPSLLSPGTSITFEWNASSGATKYHLQVNTLANFTGTDLFNAELGSVTSREVTGFSLGTTYYWHVKAGNDGGWSDWSSPTRSVLANEAP